ncbi:hypothetical protein D9756_009108 [Leucocoprinus leucothites]|uniref:Cytochrome P450 n=1 Tax=Leucocoprinus leucothites TaxID=201217 RepID=A0A8H5FV13_9AGAR|nr:hypothetical protein D9756_009108 [Leucoagaricus leucothites]
MKSSTTILNLWPFPSTWLITILFCLLTLTLLFLTVNASKHGLSKAPGPPSFPIIGNIWRLKPKSAWFELTRLKERYVYFHGLGNSVLVLNSMDAIKDLLEKRSNKYSNRPVFTVVGTMMGLGQSMPLLPYGPEWRASRKLAHVALSPAAVAKYHHVQEDLTVLLLRDFLDNPQEFFSHVRLAAGRIILVITYGLSIQSADNNYITDAEDTMQMIGESTVPGAFLADLLPILKHFTFLPFHKTAAKGRETIENFVSRPLLHVKHEMASEKAPESLTRDLLEQENEDERQHEYRVKWTSGALYGAGAETTYTTVLVFILAMAMYPEVQKKAFSEVKAYLSTPRLVRIIDHHNLPYVAAVIKECLRWHPALPLTEDDIYNNYLIPRGTVVIPNVWAIAFAPHPQYDPQEFIPERFLDKTHNVIDPLTYAFGFGKRVCPGKALAENSVFAIIANLLLTFDIQPPGGGVHPPNFGPNLVSYPEPFKCRFIPRPGMEQLVRTMAAEVDI